MTRTIAALALALAWYVVTYSGQRFAGPFVTIGECNAVAAALHETHPLVSNFCQAG